MKYPLDISRGTLLCLYLTADLKCQVRNSIIGWGPSHVCGKHVNPILQLLLCDVHGWWVGDVLDWGWGRHGYSWSCGCDLVQHKQVVLGQLLLTFNLEFLDLGSELLDRVCLC